MSLRALLTEFASSVEAEDPGSPERRLLLGVIMRALWDSGDSGKVKTVKASTKQRNYKRKEEHIPNTPEGIKADAIEWLISDNTEELSLRWWLELGDFEPNEIQPLLIKQIGKVNPKKVFVTSSRGLKHI